MPKNTRVHSLLASLLAALALATPNIAAAQPSPPVTANGSISGTVAGDHGPLGGATVTLSGPASRSAVTQDDGRYAFPGLPPGAYQLTAKAPGYQALAPTAVTVTTGLNEAVNVTLARASLGTLRTIASTSTLGRSEVTINRSGAALDTLSSQAFLERGQTQVENMLEEEPGVELARFDSTAPGANTTVAVRGAAPYETQTLVDGHPVSGGGYGDYLIQFLNPLALSGIEIDKGPGSMGDTIENAVGGTVNFRTPQITTRLTGLITSGYDSYNGSTYSLRISDTIGKVGFLAAYGFAGTPGYYDGHIYNVDAVNTSVPGQAPQLATAVQSVPAGETYQNRSQVFKLSYNFSPTTVLTLGSLGEQSYVNYTATLSSVEPYTIVESTKNCSSCGYTNPALGGLIGQTVLASNQYDGLYLGNFEYDNEPIFTADLRTQIGPGSFLGRYYTGAIDRNIDDPEEAQQITECQNPGCTMKSFSGAYYEGETDRLDGADFQYAIPFGYEGQDYAVASFDDHADKSRDCSGALAVFSASDCSVDNLILTSRTYSLRAFANVLPKVRVGFANYFSDTTFVGSRYDPRASIVWTPQRQTAVRASIGTAYVAPPLNFVAPQAGANKAVVNGTLNVNDALLPESSAGFDIGADFGVHNDSKFTIDAYSTRIDHRFSTLTITPPADYGTIPLGSYDGTPFTKISELYNASDANEEGLEFGYTRAPRVGFGVRVRYDLSRAYNFNTILPRLPYGLGVSGAQTSTVAGDGLESPGYQIPGYAYSHGRVAIDYAFPSSAQFGLGASVYGANNSFGEPGFSQFDFSSNFPVNGGLRILASVSNLFNHDDYRTLTEYGYGYSIPGESTPYSLFFVQPRTVTLQLAYPFGER